MRLATLFLLALSMAVPSTADGRGLDGVQIDAKRHLVGLTEAEADALIAQLQDAQRRLRAGEQLYFSLLSGSSASYAQARLVPFQVFLDMPFHRVWSVTRIERDGAWQRAQLAFAPKGIGQAYWEIEVIVSRNGVERVVMLFRPPAPS